ncbi:AfsR/SARP family transcriptional regulator [Streptomyces graminilatus]|uniref:AfsR/SARP family transcriptional regulator n=1 Tax=Streptomyces graminilatus TaxID=1464070 RepID=UPI0006E1ABDC|nr:BTAD domain-containing putative transcriptional regulator [Streptomyces graminilatus]
MRVTVLGPLRAWRDGTELELGPPRRKALLALLLTQVDQPVPADEIVEVLWGDNAPDSAMNVVHRHIGTLRKALGPVLVRASGGYRLHLDTGELDLLRFRALRADAAQSRRTGDDIAGTRQLLAALDLWHGPIAGGLPTAMRAHPLIARVEREYPDTVKEAVDAAMGAGDVHLERVLMPLRRAAHAHPLDETLHARLVTALARTGHTREARRSYEDVRRRLDEDLGLEPGPELAEAGARLRTRSDATAPASIPSPTAAGDGITPTTRPAQLPPDLGVFSGRHTELALARSLLSADGLPGRPVVISAIGGMAGVGKTTLALHWAHEVAPRYPDGQLFADLRGFDPGGATAAPAQILRGFLDALGVASEHIPLTVDAQASLYRSLLAGKRVLVVLDNARDPEQVRPLLPGAGGCLVIVTSRTFLSGLVAEGAHPVALDVLDEAASQELLARRLGTRRLTEQPDAVRDIVRACAGLPLALAVVSARMSMNPHGDLGVLASELTEDGERLATLSAGDPSTDLRTVFSWSYRALTPPAALLFRLLALHPGPEVSLDAASSLLGLPRPETRSALSELAGAHLLTERLAGRFGCHDLLRAYAGDLLQAHDSQDDQILALRRLLDHLLHSARHASALLAPQGEQPALPDPVDGAVVVGFRTREQAANWLESERAVILAAVAHGPARTHLPSRCWQLAATVELHLDRLGRWQEQLALQTAALDAAERAGDQTGRAHAHRALGFVHGRLGDPDAATEHLTTALDLFRAVADPAGEARTQRYLAFQANRDGRHEDALIHYGLAHTLYADSGNLTGQAQVHNEVGWTHILRGDHSRALVECHRAIDLHRQLGNPNGEAAAWDSLGYAHHHLSDHEQAIDCYRQALTLYRHLHDAYLEADTLVHIGDSQQAAGAPADADGSWRQALRILERLGHPDAAAVRQRLAG